MSSFSGKKILVTGAGGGIGKVLVAKLLGQGAIVYALDKESSLLDALKISHPDVICVQVNLMDWDSTRAAVEKICPVDCLINNAGVVIPESFFDTKPESIDLSFGIQFKGAFNVSQVVSKAMVDAGIHGSIVNVSSVTAFRASKNLGTYCASKASMDMLTKIMAVELGEYKIRVNSVNPTAVATEMARRLPHDDGFMRRTPLKRIATVEEVVTAILFVLGDGCPMMTGASIPVDGGYSACAN